MATAVASTMQQAVARHNSGQLAEAERLYREILAQAPGDVYALYLLGALKYQQGEHPVAVELLQAATRVNPDYAAPYACLGLALRELKKLERALASFDRALVLKPDDAEVLNNRGNALLEVGRHEEALASYERALRLQPAFAAALVGRGIALLRLGRPGEALPTVDRALALNHENVLALNARGNALIDLKRPAEALASLDRALSLKPDFAEALSNRGNALLDLKRPAEALASYDRALALKPDFVEGLTNRGNALRDLKRPEEALASYDRALALKPDFVEAISNRGNAQRDLKRLDDALASYARALALKPDYANAHVNESLTRLLAGDFETGWRKHEWRWQTDEGKNFKRNFNQPLWLGSPTIDGKSILLHAEQGFGDTLQFCRYARLVAAQGATVLMEVQPELKSLLAKLEGVTRVLAYGEPLPAFDYQCPLLSLPLAFNTTESSIPAKVPYLSTDAGRVAEWRRRLGDTKLPRIGIVWSGRSEQANDRNRSVPLAKFAKLVSGDAEFISLQKEVRASDVAVLSARQHIRHVGDQLNEFADTAAVVELVDLVITVDTALAHLAGALGVPVWILLPFNPDWRWLLDRSDSPWYPTARLFRPAAFGDWDSVIERIAIELHEWYLTRAESREVHRSRRASVVSGDRSAQPPRRLEAEAPTAVAAKLQQAVARHKSGQLTEAERLYREILAQVPADAYVLYLLGALKYQQGEHQSAADSLLAATRVNPNYAAPYAYLGLALRELKKLEQALASFDRALVLKPDDAEVLNNRGNALLEVGRPEEALASYERALRLQPAFVAALVSRGIAMLRLGRPGEALPSLDRALALNHENVMALNARGNALVDLRRPAEALASLDRALSLKPDFAEALSNRGNALLELQRPEESLASFDRAVALKPDLIEGLVNRGNVLRVLKRPQEALASYDRALALAPNLAEVYSNRGIAFAELKRPAEALASYDKAIALKPDYAEAYSNRGNALRDLNRPEEGLASHDKAIALKPDYAEGYSNRGLNLTELKRLDEARASYDKAIALKPDYGEAYWNKSLALLVSGDFASGWPLYEYRWKRKATLQPAFSQPLWLGAESVAGKTVFLHCEQGLGDSIQFCRYAKLVAALGAKILLAVQKPLVSLLKDLEGVSQLVTEGDAIPHFDYHCPLLSLPLAFQTTLETIPGAAAYLRADPAKVRQWRQKLGEQTNPRIGIVWSGNTEHPNDRKRSVPLAKFAKLVSGDAEFISLQKDVRAADQSVLNAQPHIRHVGDQLNEFADTAAVVELLDVVITVDTAVAHLAGALGVAVWVLLPFSPDWRWLLDRSDSPWYPTARLLRQPAVGDWESVIERIAIELRERYLTRAEQRRA